MALTKTQYEEFWRIADKNNDGQLSLLELAAALRKYRPDIQDRQIAGMFCGIDKDEDKSIAKQEFLDEMVNKQKRSEYFENMWRKYDKDSSGELTRGEVMEIIKDYFPPEQKNRVVGEFLAYCDLDGSGQISKTEFMQFFC